MASLKEGVKKNDKKDSVEGKKITELTIEELSALKQIVDTESERYAGMLTTYATMNADPYLERINRSETLMYERRRKYVKLKEMIESEIDNKLEEICKVNNV